MNSDEKTETEKDNKNLLEKNVQDQFDTLAHKTFIEVPKKLKSDKKRHKLGSNIFHNSACDESKNDIDDELFYENFMDKLNIKTYKINKHKNGSEFFYKKTFSHAIKNLQSSKTPKLIRNKKIVPSQTYNQSNNNSISSIKSSGGFYNKKHKKVKPTPSHHPHSPFIGSIPKGNHSGRMSPKNNCKLLNVKGNNNVYHNNSPKSNNNNNTHKRRRLSFTPNKQQLNLPIKTEGNDISNNEQCLFQYGISNHNNNNNTNKKGNVKELSSTKTQKTLNEESKAKNINTNINSNNNNNNNAVTIFGEISTATTNKETKKKKRLCFLCCIPKKIPVP